jgi:hypothetical protein
MFITGVLCVFEFPLMASYVLAGTLLYNFWTIIQDGFASTTPGKAVGFLFIPIFNLYWYFRAFYGLSKDIKFYIDRHFSDEQKTGVHTSKRWISLTIPVFVLAIGAISIIVMNLYYSPTGQASVYSTISTLRGFSVALLPDYIVLFAYFAFSWGLITAMFIDFFKAIDSILKAEA